MANSPIRVLVVDDNADVATVTAELLGMYGFDVEAASSGVAGITVARNLRPDVVLLDLAMPDTDGLLVANTLRSTPETRSTKLIAYSGYSSGQVYKDAHRVGFDKFICKPAPIEILIEAIHEVTK